MGQENKGWDYAKFLLGNERTGIARVGASKARIRRLKELAALEQSVVSRSLQMSTFAPRSPPSRSS